MANEIDLSQFYAIFVEESSELIEEMEAGLLNLELGDIDAELVNTIFRAAHSIKGSGATLGFNEISSFTHGVEALLEQMRSGERRVTQDAIELLLECVDCLRGMIKCCDSDENNDQTLIEGLSQRLESLLNGAEDHGSAQLADLDKNVSDTESECESAIQEPLAITEMKVWSISFRPHPNLFFSGNDPFRMIRELETFGDLEVLANVNNIPSFTELDPQQCFLSWELKLTSTVDEKQIREVFAWVEEDSDLEIVEQLAETDITLNVKSISLDSQNKNDGATPEDGIPESVDSTEVGSVHPGRAELEELEKPRASGRRREDVTAEESTSIRVSTEKVDELVNMVGELVITQSMLTQATKDLDLEQYEKLSFSLQQLERNTQDLQDKALGIRMMPVSFAFNRLPRIVHDLNRSLDKQVKLTLSGENTEVDKTVLEKIGDPLVHLVRNALDHGVETPEERRAAGKEGNGTIHVEAFHQGGNIIVQVSDDGAGLDISRILKKAKSVGLIDDEEELTPQQTKNLIFEPGFSTAIEVSNVSGRGVGMDVVKRNITDLGGTVEVTSELGSGAKFTIRLPLTLAILDGQMVSVDEEVFVVPVLSIVESVRVEEENIHRVAGEAEIYKYRDMCLPIIRLGKLFGIASAKKLIMDGFLIIVDIDGQLVGLNVDEVLGQQQVVIKSIEKNFRHIPGVSGATILGDGSVALIVDVMEVFKLSLVKEAA